MAISRKKIHLLHGDCKKLLAALPANSIDLVVTSPPYDNLRSYNGQAPFTFKDFKTIARELQRVLSHSGVIVWVVGDAVINGSETGHSFRQALHFKSIGLNLHDTMIYQKSGFSFPMKNRYHQIFEYMFVLSKGRPKTFNPIKDRINRCVGEKIRGSWRGHNGQLFKKSAHGKGKRIERLGRRSNIWKILNGYLKTTTDRIAFRHPAIFPDQLARDHIISWSNKGDIVLDPFMGSGTTGKMCKLLNRRFIGMEIDRRYFALAKSRIGQS